MILVNVQSILLMNLSDEEKDALSELIIAAMKGARSDFEGNELVIKDDESVTVWIGGVEHQFPKDRPFVLTTIHVNNMNHPDRKPLREAVDAVVKVEVEKVADSNAKIGYRTQIRKDLPPY